ncbi:uncharacterized protein ZK643.6-like [Clytia hemisphaerica]|uniref:uncharacterized protein ZK643.6-like n=1 Tax=Clytia hemisphaerica TaxID=252671 RepID=UPI0034D4A2BB
MKKNLFSLVDRSVGEDLFVEHAGSVIFQDPCHDHRPDCSDIKTHCYEEPYLDDMKENCRATCGFCKPCKENNWRESKCIKIFEHHYCTVEKYKPKLKENCFKTCYCGEFAAPLCEFDVEGCCWDRTSLAREGCKACGDMPHVRFLCKQAKWNPKDECFRPHSLPSRWFQKNCPASCGLCNNCRDFVQFEDDCLQWVEEGKCEEPVNKIRCQKSCGICS